MALLVTHAAPGRAQILRRQQAGLPPNWIGGGVEIQQGYTLRDGSTSSQWSFDSGLGYTASFEHPTQSGIMLGLQGSYATPTLIYTSTTSAGNVNCLGGC